MFHLLCEKAAVCVQGPHLVKARTAKQARRPKQARGSQRSESGMLTPGERYTGALGGSCANPDRVARALPPLS